MSKRSIFSKSVNLKKLIFPLSICFIVSVFLNTLGKGMVKVVRTKLIDGTVRFSQSMQNLKDTVSILIYFFNQDINKSILELHKKNMHLKYEMENLRHLKVENDELRSFLEIKKAIPNSVVIAKITSVFSNDYVKSCIINAGKNDGIEVDDVVRNSVGLIGRICEVHEKWSCVLAITDRNSKIPVKIGKEEINAILSGDNSRFLSVSMKNEDTQIKNGDIAKTAYMENAICDEIPVGRVVEKQGEFVIEPFVDVERIQNVCVLKGGSFEYVFNIKMESSQKAFLRTLVGT